MKTTSDKTKIAIFASGSGSNAEAIIRYFNFSADAPGQVALVVTNRADAGVVERAGRLGVAVVTLTRSELNDAAVMLPLMERHGIEIIALAGFLMMIPLFLIERYEGRMVNIHPSLLPKYGGKGMYGHHVHEAVVAARETETGITIHLVSERYDEGAILLQARVGLSPTDTPADVAAKVHTLEHHHYPRLLASLCLRAAR